MVEDAAAAAGACDRPSAQREAANGRRAIGIDGEHAVDLVGVNDRARRARADDADKRVAAGRCRQVQVAVVRAVRYVRRDGSV
jgi:hypothetical protein